MATPPLEEATFLTRFASKVTLVHRRDELRASKIMQDRAFANDKIEFAWNSEVAELIGDDRLEGVVLRDTQTGETRKVDATGLFIAIGHDPRSELIKGQVELDDEGYVLVNAGSTSYQSPGRLCGRRSGGPHLPPGHHRGRDRLCGRPRCRAVPRRSRARSIILTTHPRHRIT